MRGVAFKQWEVQTLAAGRLRAIVRVVKPRKNSFLFGNGWSDEYITDEGNHSAVIEECPIGQPGERFFVRETWGHDAETNEECRLSHEDMMGGPYCPYYKADERGEIDFGIEWRSPVTMPEWAARFRPLIESVRVCKVQELSESERCAAFGLSPITRDFKEPKVREQFNADNTTKYELNPWVWFVRIKEPGQ